MKTKYKLKGSSIYLYNCKYYYVDRNGNRKLLNVYDGNYKEKDSVSVQIINWGCLGMNGKSQVFNVNIPNNNFFKQQKKNGI